jgi:predicted transcriptional regulator
MSFSSDITWISIGLSVISFAIAAVSLFIVGRFRSRKEEGDEQVDALALVQEFRRRNEALEGKLIDLRVQLEILGLRVARITGKEAVNESVSQAPLETAIRKGMTLPSQRSAQFPTKSYETPRNGGTIDPIRREILSAVMDANGTATSRAIQQKIGRSREHVARTMNTLQKQGLLHRNQEARPFSYSITREGENELRSIA